MQRYQYILISVRKPFKIKQESAYTYIHSSRFYQKDKDFSSRFYQINITFSSRFCQKRQQFLVYLKENNYFSKRDFVK